MNVKIIYETQTGTTQYVAEVMESVLKTLGHQVTLHSVRTKGNQPELEGFDLVLFGSPTYEDGKLENAMNVFTKTFHSDLSKYKIGVFGLGNSTYPLFCKSAEILQQWVEGQGGKVLTEPLMIDGFPDDISPISEWVKKVLVMSGK
jgi:flavodoxin